MSIVSTVTAERPAGRVLLAEDNQVSQRVGSAMLRYLGFEVDVAGDGAEAVEAASINEYQAILMDCQIPVLDGYEATGEIRRLEGVRAHTPIIAVTGSTQESEQAHCLSAGMDDFLPKPLSLKTLASALDRWAPDGTDPIISLDPAGALPATDLDPSTHDTLVGPALDAEVRARLEHLGDVSGEDLMGQLAAIFLTDADGRILALHQALAAGDAAAIHRTAHTLGGASANLGALDLARACSDLATRSLAGDLAGAGERVDAVEVELERVRAALSADRGTP
jgi:CheY-like chemotaxis protein/HPt (histidine-containing phosphotransfer) domain-containing protein